MIDIVVDDDGDRIFKNVVAAVVVEIEVVEVLIEVN